MLSINPTQPSGATVTFMRPLPFHAIPASLHCNFELCRKYILLILSTFKAKQPSRHEVYAVSRNMDKMKTKYTDEHEHYLVDLYLKAGLASSQKQYVRKGDIWKELGFQNPDPASDIRGGGLLCLDNMLYFLQAHRHLAQNMIQKRSKGWDTYETFPWAPASINLTRLVAAEFGICGAGSGGQIRREHEIFPSKTSYHMLLETEGFSRIYVLAFVLLDKVWDEQQATYMQFNSVIETVRRELSEAIILATSLTELEQQIFNRVNYTPLLLYPEDDSSLPSQRYVSDSDTNNKDKVPSSKIIENNSKDSFFKQKVPESVFYASMEDLETFLCASPAKVSDTDDCHHHSSTKRVTNNNNNSDDDAGGVGGVLPPTAAAAARKRTPTSTTTTWTTHSFSAPITTRSPPDFLSGGDDDASASFSSSVKSSSTSSYLRQRSRHHSSSSFLSETPSYS